MAEDKLRKVPLFNSFSAQMPRVCHKLNFPQLNLPALSDTQKHIQAWVEECDQVVQRVDQVKSQNSLWAQWYREQYLNKQPPGMLGSAVLHPKKK